MKWLKTLQGYKRTWQSYMSTQKGLHAFADYGRAVLCILATVMVLAGIIWAVRGLIR